ncbi:MAG: oxidoreductase [Methylocystaceae bacterium]|jgi:hypothetical protein|nr:oxidoreductase [Methylocystaceae bacterium]NBT96971.1 oxidoreductase [Methylocystaceae bacterium]
MTKLPELKSPVAAKIEQHYLESQTPRDDENLRCSSIGNECERALWYNLRWTTTLKPHAGRMERLFQTGHREELRMINDLRLIGCDVYERDPVTGNQWHVTFLNGILQGSSDGKIVGVPGAENTVHLLECKTASEKSFTSWREKGVETDKPVHFFQMQIYMKGLSLDRALYIVHNKNTDEIETERVKYNPVVADRIIEKAERIARASEPPSKTESWICRNCRHEKICRYDDWPRVNCRTCVFSEIVDGNTWACTRDDHKMNYAEQQRGCEYHIYIPELVPGEVIDSSELDHTVTYQLRVAHEDNAIYVDGRDPKPQIPEAI